MNGVWFLLSVVPPTFTRRRCETPGLKGSYESLVLNAPVLEPNLNLFFRETQRRGDLDTPQTGQVDSVAERPFQFQELAAAERCPCSLEGATVCCHNRLWTYRRLVACKHGRTLGVRMYAQFENCQGGGELDRVGHGSGPDFFLTYWVGSGWVQLLVCLGHAKFNEPSLGIHCAYTGNQSFIKSKFSKLLLIYLERQPQISLRVLLCSLQFLFTSNIVY